MKALSLLILVFVIGCGPKEAPVAASAQRIHEIVKNSNGNWDSLSESDRQFLIQELGRGNETNARFSFQMQAGKGGPGGPPAPGAN